MELNITEEILNDGVNLSFTNMDKFKTNLMSVYIVRPLNREEITKNVLLPLILKRGTQNYKTSLEIERKFEELYGSGLGVNATKKGNRQIIRFTIEGPQERFIGSGNLLEEQLKMLNEIINNPLTEEGVFSNKYVELEKRNLKTRIEGRINNKKQYAVDRCIEEMCKDEVYSLYQYGYITDLEKITSAQMYEHYKTIIKTSPIYISMIGNFEEHDVKKMVEKTFKFERGTLIDIPKDEMAMGTQRENKVFEEMEINQGKLTLGFRTNISYKDSLYESFLLASNILGGGANSKLFVNVREKESLAYYVYTKSYKYKSIMLIAAGIEFENYDKSLKIINEQVEELKAGNFSDKDIQYAKKSIVTSLQSMTDSSFSISEYYFGRKLTQSDRSIEDIIEKINSVNKDDIVKAASKLELDTIYFLKNKGNTEEEIK